MEKLFYFSFRGEEWGCMARPNKHGQVKQHFQQSKTLREHLFSILILLIPEKRRHHSDEHLPQRWRQDKIKMYKKKDNDLVAYSIAATISGWSILKNLFSFLTAF